MKGFLACRTTLLLLAAVSVSCGGPHGRTAAPASPAPSTSASSPATAEETVAAYYSFIGRHDATDAAALLDPDFARGQVDPTGVGNIVSLRHLRDLKAAPASLPPAVPAGYTDITQVFVTYDVVYKHEIAAMNGANSRFLYLGRNAAGQWRIFEIGTGP